MKESGTDDLARVHGYDCAPAILVAQEVMAAFDAENGETGLAEGSYEVHARDAGTPAQAAMVTR